jgi:hypothetical protein
VLATESQAQRIISPLSGRYWTITNPSSINRPGQPVSYKLMPGKNVLPFAGEDASVLKRAAFTTRHLWVTPDQPRERYAAGDYPNQHPGGAGLPQYTRGDRPITDTDVVVWYTFGAHHVVRPEDWPVMPVSTIGFSMKPVGFLRSQPRFGRAAAGARTLRRESRAGLTKRSSSSSPGIRISQWGSDVGGLHKTAADFLWKLAIEPGAKPAASLPQGGARPISGGPIDGVRFDRISVNHIRTPKLAAGAIGLPGQLLQSSTHMAPAAGG